MSQSNPQSIEPTPSARSIEQVLYERMGVTVDDAIAAGTDFLDEKVEQAARSGVDMDARASGLGKLLEQLTEPSTLAALSELVRQLPKLAQLASLANEFPNLLATFGDVVDDYQQRLDAEGIDVEKALRNGLHTVLYLGSKVDVEHLHRVGDLLNSDILNPSALDVIDNAAKSLNSAQQEVCEPSTERIGMFGLLAALRDPQVQRSLAFAVKFGKCFGKNIDSPNT